MATRNLRERIPAGTPGAGKIVAGTRYVGLLGSEIMAATATGDHGAGLFVPWSPEAGNRYRVLVTALTGGPLVLREDGSGEAPAPFTATLSVYENNLLVAEGIVVSGTIVVEAYSGGGNVIVGIVAVGAGLAAELSSGGGNAIVLVAASGDGVAVDAPGFVAAGASRTIEVHERSNVVYVND